MLKETIETYKLLGLLPIPIVWDADAKGLAYNIPGWQNFTVETLPVCTAKHTGIMLRMHGEWGCLDFDLKNTTDKTIFDRWMQHIAATAPDILGKLFIERTRSAGYHVFIRYHNLPHKQQWAQSEHGSEVIALYANGPLIYTFPTPGYTEVHQGMQDVEPLTDIEFLHIQETSQYFNEYKPAYDPAKKAISYPQGFEKYLSDFDNLISHDSWVTMLFDIGLQELTGFRYHDKDKFKAFRRIGSESPGISAKVYMKSKRLMLFTASMPDYPNWHTKEEYPCWCLPPSFVLFYKHNRSWAEAMKQIETIALTDGIGEAPKATGEFPLHVFPTSIAASISEVSNQRSLPPQFLASACLWGVSALAGNAYVNRLLPDTPNILYMLFIAPVSVGKSPAVKTAVLEPLKRVMAEDAAQHKQLLDAWNIEKQTAASKKKTFVTPRPIRYLPIIQDGTTESFLSIHTDQQSGIGVFYDEAETLFNAGNYKAINDSVTFLTTIFSGGQYIQTRANRELERVIPDVNINIIMGTQPERTGIIFTQDKIDSGFAARFLPVVSDYIHLNENADPMSRSAYMCQDWRDIMAGLYNFGKDYNNGTGPRLIDMTPEAVELYRKYYKEQLQAANQRIINKSDKVIIGLGAKMSSYLMRVTQILAIIHNTGHPVINATIMQYGLDLFNYYYGTAERFIVGSLEDAETGLPKELNLLYNGLPDTFKSEDAVKVCERLNLPHRRFETAMRRKDFKQLFKKQAQGIYFKQ